MTAYDSHQPGGAIQLLDIALEAISADEPIQLRVHRDGDHSEYIVGLLKGAYRSPGGDRVTLTFQHTTVVVYDTDEWSLVVAEPEPDYSNETPWQQAVRQALAAGPGAVHTVDLPRVASADVLSRGRLVIPPEIEVALDPELEEAVTASGAERQPFVTIRSINGDGYLVNWPQWGARPGRTVIHMSGDPEYHGLSNALDFFSGDEPEEWTGEHAERVELIGTEEAQRALNDRMHAAEERAGRIHYLGHTDENVYPEVVALRWKDGEPSAWEGGHVIRRLSGDSYLIRYRDREEKGAVSGEIRASQKVWARLTLMAITTSQTDN